MKLYYKGTVSEEGRIDEIIAHYEKKKLPKKPVDFTVEPQWIQFGHLCLPYQDVHREKYFLSTWAEMMRAHYDFKRPERFKGIALDLDEGCEPLWFCFAKYDRWVLNNFTRTQDAKYNFLTHIMAAELIRELKPYVDNLQVFDEGEYYESRDVNRLARNFVDAVRTVKGERLTGKTMH